MKLIIAVIAVILSAGCANVSMKYDPASGMVDWNSNTLWKDITQFEAATGDAIVTLGSSTSEQEASALMLVCTINPALPMCMMDK